MLALVAVLMPIRAQQKATACLVGEALLTVTEVRGAATLQTLRQQQQQQQSPW
jgi:hypothetical protein